MAEKQVYYGDIERAIITRMRNDPQFTKRFEAWKMAMAIGQGCTTRKVSVAMGRLFLKGYVERHETSWNYGSCGINGEGSGTYDYSPTPLALADPAAVNAAIKLLESVGFIVGTPMHGISTAA